MPRRSRFSTEPFGATVGRLMTTSGTTYRELAATAELSAGYLNRLVHGNRPVPDDDVVERVAQALKVRPEYFREYRLRVLVEQLETRPEVVDRLYVRLTHAA